MDPRASYFLIVTDQRRNLDELALERELRGGDAEHGGPGGPGLIARLRRRLGGTGGDTGGRLGTTARRGASEVHS
jgi:hypothetical protein